MGTPCSAIASSRARVPITLVCQYFAGLVTDSPTSDLAAKCSTASNSPPASTSALRPMSRLHELDAGRDDVGVPGRAVVQHHHLVPLGHQQPGHHRTDVTGAADHQSLHALIAFRVVDAGPGGGNGRRRAVAAAATSGVMSLTKAPMADSEPARNFSLPTARRMEKISRCSQKSVPTVVHRRLVPRRDGRQGVVEHAFHPAQHLEVDHRPGCPLGLVSAGRSGTWRRGYRCTSSGQWAANGTKATQCSFCATILAPSAISPASTSANRLRPVPPAVRGHGCAAWPPSAG